MQTHQVEHSPAQLEYLAVDLYACDRTVLIVLRREIEYKTRKSNQTDERSGHHDTADDDSACCNEREILPPPPMELIPIPPRRHLRPLRIAHPHERRPLLQSREPDVVRRHSQLRVAKQPLAFFNGLPALLQRREIPSLARA